MMAVYPVEMQIDEIWVVWRVVVEVETPGGQKTLNDWDQLSGGVLVNDPDEEQVEVEEEEELNDENDVEVVISTNCHYGTWDRRTQSPSEKQTILRRTTDAEIVEPHLTPD